MNKLREKKIYKLLSSLGIRNIPHDKLNLINAALTHRSYYRDQDNINPNLYNQRLEFLGDAIIGLVISEYVYKKYKDEDEGRLTKLKSYLVSKHALYLLAKELNLEKYIQINEGVEKDNPKILADMFEALIGSIYLITNLSKVKEILINMVKDKEIMEKDYKGELQQIIQKEYKKLPQYVLVKEEGLPHAKTFYMIVKLNRKILGEGKGLTKKEAQINAAYDALRKLNKIST